MAEIEGIGGAGTGAVHPVSQPPDPATRQAHDLIADNSTTGALDVNGLARDIIAADRDGALLGGTPQALGNLLEQADLDALQGAIHAHIDANAQPLPAPQTAGSAEGFGSFVEGAILGDFSGNDSWSATGGQIAGGFVPIAGQIADARDTAAAVGKIWNGESGGWFDLGTSVIGWVPGLGDAAKAALRGGDRALDAGTEVAQQAVRRGDEVLQTGARELSRNTVEGWDQAEAAYDVIRRTDDVGAIARNTGWSEARIQTVKDHLFHNTHQLDEGVRRFDADPEIANAWHRMQAGTARQTDFQLLEHELFEARFEGIFGTNYRTAHDATIRSGRTWDVD